MSFPAQKWVIEQSQQRGSAYLVLRTIAWHANDKKKKAWPGIALLAQECRMSERQVTRLVRKLEKSGEVFVQRSDGISNTYTFPLMKESDWIKGSPEATPSSSKTRQDVTLSDAAVPLTNRASTPDISGATPDITVSADPTSYPSFIPTHPARADASGVCAETDERLRAEGKGKEKGRASKKSTSSASRTSPKKTPCPTVEEFLTDERVAFVRETYPGVKASYVTEQWHNTRRARGTTRVSWEHDWKAYFSSFAGNHADEFKAHARSAPPPPARPLTPAEIAADEAFAAANRAGSRFATVLSSDEREQFYKTVGKAASKAYLNDPNLSPQEKSYQASRAGQLAAESFKLRDTDKSVGIRAEELLAARRAAREDKERQHTANAQSIAGANKIAEEKASPAATRAEWSEKCRAELERLKAQCAAEKIELTAADEDSLIQSVVQSVNYQYA